ncbi:MAG: hypothetical protein HY811_03330 [Planctomycetes bacterium]|nr:hypothetical protein [Planctomycetota bacterium]
MKQTYCCANFRKYVKKNKIKRIKSKRSFSLWAVPKAFELYHCPFCGKYNGKGDIHIDFVALPVKQREDALKKLKPFLKTKKGKYCCGRFKDAVKEEEFISAYRYGKGIEETSWVIPGFYHLYFCPFCGTYIKGRGYGVPPEPYKKADREKLITFVS